MRGGPLVRGFAIALAGLLVAGLTAWAAGAIYYSNIPGARLRSGLAVAFVVMTVLAFVFLKPRFRMLVGFVVAFGLIVMWWFTIPATNDRDWQPEVAVTPWAHIDGDLVTIRGVRNLDYRTEADFVPHWDDRTYDLRKLDSVDLIAVYWAGQAIAHIMLSFGFEGKDYVAFSIETRKAKGQNYSTIGRVLKEDEPGYNPAQQRHRHPVGTDYRQPQEDVYVYR